MFIFIKAKQITITVTYLKVKATIQVFVSLFFHCSIFIHHNIDEGAAVPYQPESNQSSSALSAPATHLEAELSMPTVAAASGWKGGGGGEMGGERVTREGVRHRDVTALGTAAAASEDLSLRTEMECERTLPMTTPHKRHDQREDM